MMMGCVQTTKTSKLGYHDQDYKQWKHDYLLSRAWGWGNNDNYEMPLRNFFDPSDDVPVKPIPYKGE
jgi:hypothetical protein